MSDLTFEQMLEESFEKNNNIDGTEIIIRNDGEIVAEEHLSFPNINGPKFLKPVILFYCTLTIIIITKTTAKHIAPVIFKFSGFNTFL